MAVESQLRATFKDTKKAQEKLRIELDNLETNNQHIKPEKRGEIFELLADALLGLDYEKKCALKMPDYSSINIDNLGFFIRCLIYYENNVVEYSFLKRFGKVHELNVSIGLLWHELKFVLFGIYPEALSMSIRISKEIVDTRRRVKTIQTVSNDGR